MAVPQKIPWISIVAAFVLFAMFAITGNDRYAIGVPAAVTLGMLAEYRRGNQSFGSRSTIGYAIDAYIMVAVALGLLALGANLVLSPSTSHPRWTFVLGISLIPLGIALVSYAFHYFKTGRRRLGSNRDGQP